MPHNSIDQIARWFAPGYQWPGWELTNDSNCLEPKPVWRGKGSGDANCDGKTNITDFSIWRQESIDLGADELEGFWEANFSCPLDYLVDMNDFSIWREHLYD